MFGGIYINNIAVAMPATVSNCQVGVAPYTMWNTAVLDAPSQAPYDTWSNNITDMIGTGCNGEVALSNSNAPIHSGKQKEHKADVDRCRQYFFWGRNYTAGWYELCPAAAQSGHRIRSH
jgi:hypothetical protein